MAERTPKQLNSDAARDAAKKLKEMKVKKGDTLDKNPDTFTRMAKGGVDRQN